MTGLDQALRAIVAAGEMSSRRLLVAVAGPPGSGKSTFADTLAELLRRQTSRRPAVVAQDGFHLDNAVLESRNLGARKGAPETFDVEGLWILLGRLRRGTDDVAAPIFDRELDRVTAETLVVPAATDTIIVEGNYLLLEAPPWSRLRPLYDLTILLTCATKTLRSRLIERWLRYGLNLDAAMARADGNDLANARLVMEGSSPADLVIAND